jgi:lipoprotein-releasing system permease protein
MNLPFLFARRYLFSKKSTNAINVISAISVLGMTLGTAALIIVLSVFNGFEDLITSLYNSFNPDLKITAKEGKSFIPDSQKMAALRKIKGVKAVSQCVDEIAFFEYGKRQDFGIIKGVDSEFERCNGIKGAIKRGDYNVLQGDQHNAVIGMGMEYKLGISIDDPFTSLKVYMPKRESGFSLMGAPFKVAAAQPVGVFAIQADFDGQYVLADLEHIRALMSYDNGEVSDIEMGIDSSAAIRTVQSEVKQIVGNEFIVKNRYEQDEAFYKIMNMERWVGFAIATLTLLLVAFNMVGSLWMLVIDKRRDIAILQAMGATPKLIQRIFLTEGLLLSGLGMFLGFSLAIFFVILQKQFGIIQLGGNMVVDSYPISLRFIDFVLVGTTVASIGLLASYLPARRAAQVDILEVNK